MLIFLKTAKAIEELYETDSCVIIGRCANSILKNKKNVLSIFVYSSDEEFKVQRKVRYAGLNEKEAVKIIRKMDKERASYYNYYTDGKWGAKEEYDLCIDTSKIGVDNAVELIIKLASLKGLI